MIKYRIDQITENLDNLRKPLNSIERNKISKKKLYPYYGANNLMDYVDEYIFDEEILCVAEDGGNWGYTEKCTYIVNEKCWVNNHAHVLKAKDNLNIAYLSYYLNYNNLNSYITGTTRGKLTKTALSNIEILLPELEKQNIIVEILDKAQKLIDKRKEQIKELDDLVKSQFIKMFGDPVQNPFGWNIRPFLDSGNCKNGMNFSATETGVELQYLGVGDFKDLSKIEDVNNLGKVSLNKMPSTEYLLQDGDIVFVRSNGNKALVGRCLAVYPNGIPTTYSGFCIRYRKTDKSLEIPYLLHVLKTDSMRKNMAGRGANIQNLNQQILSELMIPIPPIELQNEFADFVKQVDKLKFEMENSLKELEDNVNSLMQKAFKGELFI
ncbi:restriction endonuclease subunit S [uncultured Clostridium sp.]|uniref:restriction endonuclease subunit S n=5 Tax=uncultured Clostridium sp. TaxID=59620 RepID=UPI002615E937|nr:restriction endonuclease subunit S [uncultured Clostridium sp.]